MPKIYQKTCPHPNCGVEFTVSGRGAALRKYCAEHYIGNTAGGRGHGGRKTAEQKEEKDRCSECGKKLTLSQVRFGNKYCGKQCINTAETAKRKERARLESEFDGMSEIDSHKVEMFRRGSGYKKLEANPEVLRPALAGTMSQREGCDLLGMTPADFSRSLAAHRYDQKKAIKNGMWVRGWIARAMLPVDKLLRIKELGPDGEGTEEFERLADELTRAYSVFSRFFFRLEGKRPLVEGFHLKWIRSIIVAYAVGGKQLILSPPRHGKSETLIRFSVWFIVMFPNVRIMWVAASKDLAELMLGAVKDHLENNEELIAATLPPGEGYRPDRSSGRKWSAKEIKIRQQTHVGQKSSSMLALGRTSKILSRDVDILLTDDIEDFDTTRELSQRKYSRNKLAEIGTRKEERTAWLYISSRQHPDDIPHHIMQLEGSDQAWRTITNSAHTECGLDPDVIEGHDESGCVLFPAVRSYRWLVEKRSEMDALGIAGAYEMRYLNQPIPDSGIVFNIPLIREVAIDKSRDLGIDGLPPGLLIAGLDPAARGTQAGFCWHYANNMMSMVDLEEQKAGGFEGAWDLMRYWFGAYGLTHWVYEANAQQGQFFEMAETKKLAVELGLVVKPHLTGTNKQDAEIGISSMAPRYHGGLVNLPYGSANARKKVNVLLRQLELWTTDGVLNNRKVKTDIKMAQWFPFPQIVRWGRDQNYQTKIERGSEQSYPGLSTTSAVPWHTTKYPKGR